MAYMQMLLRNPLWLAVLLHLLLYVSFTVTYQFTPMQAKTPDFKPVETYIYHEEKNQPLESKPMQPAQAKNDQVAPDGLLKPATPSKQAVESPDIIKIRKLTDDDAENDLTPDKNQKDDALLKILSKATARKLFYPKVAQDFHLTGTSNIGFTISPAGQVSNVTIVHSSGSAVLDNTAMTVIRSIAPVQNLQAVLKAPKFVVVSIIFG